jgi:hypothetical protein
MVVRGMFMCIVTLEVMVSGVVAAPTFYGPTPYLSLADSPFSGLPFAQFYLETFEDGTLNTPGVTAVNNNPSGSPLGVAGPSLITDSVDADDGVIDGLGRNGHSFCPSANDGGETLGSTFTFDSTVLGRLPTHVGIVWTDGSMTAPTLFEAFDALDQSLGTIGPVDIGDNSFHGTTGEDHFFGVAYPGGISKFILRDPGGINSLEVDHLQYGIATIPVPSAILLGAIGSGVVGWLRRRRAI